MMSELPIRTQKNYDTSLQETPAGFPGPTTIMLITARSDSGASAKQMLDIIRTLKQTGIRVFVASPVNPPYGIEFKKLADRFIPLPHREFSFKAMMRVRKSVRKHHITVIHSHGRVGGIYSRLLGFITHASIVHSYHGISEESGFEGFIRSTVDKVLAKTKFDPVFSSASERVRAISKHVVDEKRESYLLDSAVDLNRFPKRKDDQIAMGKVDRADPESPKNIRVGAYLRSESTRGHDHFLRIVQEAAGQAKFTCAGLTRTQLEKFGAIPDNLEVVGPLGDPTAWLYSLDVFVSTSMSDGQAQGALEAMAAGAVCLLSNIPVHEAFHKHNAAALFDPKSVQSFLAELKTVRSDRAVRDMLLGNSRYMIERFYDAGTFKSKVIEIYRTATKRSLGLVL